MYLKNEERLIEEKKVSLLAALLFSADQMLL